MTEHDEFAEMHDALVRWIGRNREAGTLTPEVEAAAHRLQLDLWARANNEIRHRAFLDGVRDGAAALAAALKPPDGTSP